MWRTRGRRTLVTLHDLIAFQTPAYFNVPEHWFEYRRGIRERASSVDGVLASSEETRTQIRLERLAIEEDRLFVVPLGTGHLRGNEDTRLPDELLARGFAEKQLWWCSAPTTRTRTVMSPSGWWRSCGSEAGPSAWSWPARWSPMGPRQAEIEAGLPNDWVFVIPDVSSAERNWLATRELVLYPIRRGFGLIPHEAAAFGTPPSWSPSARSPSGWPTSRWPRRLGGENAGRCLPPPVERSSRGPGPGRSPEAQRGSV